MGYAALNDSTTYLMTTDVFCRDCHHSPTTLYMIYEICLENWVDDSTACCFSKSGPWVNYYMPTNLS